MEKARYWGYTSIWNLLDYPAAVFPVSQVEGKEDSKRAPFLGEEDEWNWKQCITYLEYTEIRGNQWRRRICTSSSKFANCWGTLGR
jgi:hypothetical protein